MWKTVVLITIFGKFVIFFL